MPRCHNTKTRSSIRWWPWIIVATWSHQHQHTCCCCPGDHSYNVTSPQSVMSTPPPAVLNMFVKTGYLQSVRQEEIVLWMSCRYLCLCRHVYSEQISLTWAEQFKHNYKQAMCQTLDLIVVSIVPNWSDNQRITSVTAVVAGQEWWLCGDEVMVSLLIGF